MDGVSASGGLGYRPSAGYGPSKHSLKSSRAGASGGASGFFVGDKGQFGQGTIDASAVDIPVSNHADGIGSGVLRPNPFGVQGVANLDGIAAAGRAVENHDVAANCRRVDFQTRYACNSLRETLRVFVILVQARGRFLERDSSGRGNYADLTHASAKH